MSKRLENLNTIIGVLNSGAKFYRSASRQVGSAFLSETFVSHAQLRETAARDLSQIVDDAGAEPVALSPKEEAFALKSRFGTLFNDKTDVLVASLEEHEDRTLAAIRTALHHKDNLRDAEILRGLMDEFQGTHDRMKALKQGEREMIEDRTERTDEHHEHDDERVQPQATAAE